MIKQNNTIHFISGESLTSLNKGVYYINHNADGSLILDKTTDFEYVELMGVNKDYEDLVIDHIAKINQNCGFIFSGLSGTGKTLTIKNISVRLNLPVIIINKVFDSEVLQKVVNSVNTDVILFFDEVEKIYIDKLSDKLLTFFDGLNTNHKVYSFLTMNNESVSSYYFNRPGRFIFNFKFGSLDTDYAVSLFDVPEQYAERFKEFVDKIHNLTYDILNKLKIIIDLHGWEKLEIISKVFNVKETSYFIDYQIEYRVNNMDMVYKGGYSQAAQNGTLVYIDVVKDGELYNDDVYIPQSSFDLCFKTNKPVDLLQTVSSLKHCGLEYCILTATRTKTQVVHNHLAF